MLAEHAPLGAVRASESLLAEAQRIAQLEREIECAGRTDAKTLSTGEGGMWVSNNSALHEQVLTLSNHGRARGQRRQFWPDRLGYKYKMSNLQAALGCAQLARVDALVARKRAIFAAYAEALGQLPGVQLNPEPAGTLNGCWMPTLVFDPASGVTRERLLAALQAADIDGRVFFWPLSGLDRKSTRLNSSH